MTRRIVVALHGNRPRCGKTTVANILTSEYGFVRIGVADPIRRMMAALGLNDEEISGSLKDKPNDKLVGKTPRRLMQTLGREVPDALGEPELWGKLWLKAAGERQGRNIVVDDHRYPYEVQYFHRYADIVRVAAIHRNGGEAIEGASHVAETQRLESNYTIENTGSLELLVRKVHAMMDRVHEDSFERITASWKA